MSIQAAVFCPYSPFPPSVFSREEQLGCVEYIHSFSFINKEILHQAKGKKKNSQDFFNPPTLVFFLLPATTGQIIIVNIAGILRQARAAKTKTSWWSFPGSNFIYLPALLRQPLRESGSKEEKQTTQLSQQGKLCVGFLSCSDHWHLGLDNYGFGGMFLPRGCWAASLASAHWLPETILPLSQAVKLKTCLGNLQCPLVWKWPLLGHHW